MISSILVDIVVMSKAVEGQLTNHLSSGVSSFQAARKDCGGGDWCCLRTGEAAEGRGEGDLTFMLAETPCYNTAMGQSIIC